MNISYDHPGLDRLALQVVQARERGLLTQLGAQPVVASTSGGNIWSDLPFLVQDMTQYWIEGHAGMSSAQRVSFATFLAKLASAGVGNTDGLCGVVLLVLRESLETQRPLGKYNDQAQPEDSARLDDDLSIAAMLPCVNAWIGTADLKIMQLSEKSWDAYPPSFMEPGPLLRDSKRWTMAGHASWLQHPEMDLLADTP